MSLKAPQALCACCREKRVLRYLSLVLFLTSLLVMGTYDRVGVGSTGFLVMPPARSGFGQEHTEEEAMVDPASRLPDTIPDCLHQVFARHAPQRNSTPAEYRVAGIDHIYVIHWTPLAQRLVSMSSRLDRVLRPRWAEQNYVTFVSQFDAKTITDPEALCLAGPSYRSLLNGTLSVTTKHHLAYYDALVNNYTIILVLEDDADFISEFESQTSKIVSALSLVPAWSNCMISGGHGGNTYTEPFIHHSPLGIGSQYAYGYLVSHLGAAQLLAFIPIRDNPDWQMNFAARELPNFESYFSVANPVFETVDDKDGSWRSSR